MGLFDKKALAERDFRIKALERELKSARAEAAIYRGELKALKARIKTVEAVADLADELGAARTLEENMTALRLQNAAQLAEFILQDKSLARSVSVPVIEEKKIRYITTVQVLKPGVEV